MSNKNVYKDKWGFDRWADRYDEVVRKENDWMYQDYDKILDRVVEYAGKNIKGALVLDIGSGTGNLTQKFLAKGAKVIGIDPSPKMRQIAQKKCPRAEFQPGHFLKIPLPDRYVDIVVSSFAFHHVPYSEKPLAFAEMKRVLKGRGKIVIADLMFKNRQEERRIKLHLREKSQGEIVEEIEEEYYSYWDELREILLQQGFETRGEHLTSFVWIICGFCKSE